MSERQCANCKWWDRSAWLSREERKDSSGATGEELEKFAGTRFGYCRRRPPAAHGIPVTEEDDWCGEFEAE